jgi:hypothetical protein
MRHIEPVHIPKKQTARVVSQQTMKTTMNAFVKIAALFILGFVLPGGPATAAVINLDLANNASPTDSPWATVTIDELVNGDIRFTVALSDSADFDKGQVSIEQFGLNTEGIDLDSLSFIDISAGFSVNTKGSTMTKFGRFDLSVFGEKGYGFDPVAFTIVANGDNIATYTSALTNKGFLFSAKLSKGAPMAFIATTAVPIPAAAWLFVSGLIGLVGIARRKKAA